MEDWERSAYLARVELRLRVKVTASNREIGPKGKVWKRKRSSDSWVQSTHVYQFRAVPYSHLNGGWSFKVVPPPYHTLYTFHILSINFFFYLFLYLTKLLLIITIFFTHTHKWLISNFKYLLFNISYIRQFFI